MIGKRGYTAYSETLKKYLARWKGEGSEILSLWTDREDKEISFREIRETLEKKGWYERKVCRKLKRLCDDQVLVKKKLGRKTYYRLNPSKQMLIHALDTLEYLEEMVERIKESVWSAYFPLQTSLLAGNFNGVKRSWLMFHKHPFWEYCSDLTIFGFPEENELSPIERIIFYHYVNRLLECFMNLAWLRVAVLSKQLFGVQMPLDDFLRDVLFDTTLHTGPLDIKELLKILKLRPERLIRKIRNKYSDMEAKEKIKLPQPTPKLNLWRVLKDLRDRGKVNDFAVIATAGPKKVVKKGGYLVYGAEEGEPIPPLQLAEKGETNKKPVIIPYRETPRFSVYNPSPFTIKPKMILSGYKYKIEEVKDPKIIKKLKEGQLPIALTLP